MDSPPPTARLAFRQWDLADVDAMVDMYSREEVYRFLGSTPAPVVDAAAASERIDRWAGRIGGFTGVWAVTRLDEPAAPIGTVLLVGLPRSDGVASEAYEIGWHFHPNAWGCPASSFLAGRLVDDRLSSEGVVLDVQAAGDSG